MPKLVIIDRVRSARRASEIHAKPFSVSRRDAPSGRFLQLFANDSSCKPYIPFGVSLLLNHIFRGHTPSQVPKNSHFRTRFPNFHAQSRTSNNFLMVTVKQKIQTDNHKKYSGQGIEILFSLISVSQPPPPTTEFRAPPLGMGIDGKPLRLSNGWRHKYIQ